MTNCKGLNIDFEILNSMNKNICILHPTLQKSAQEKSHRTHFMIVNVKNVDEKLMEYP